jgi:hypothetical protein
VKQAVTFAARRWRLRFEMHLHVASTEKSGSGRVVLCQAMEVLSWTGCFRISCYAVPLLP